MHLNPGDYVLPALVTVLGSVGTWLLLPHGHGATRPRLAHQIGYALTGIVVLLLAAMWVPPGDFLVSMFFYVFGIVAVVGGVLTVTSRNPIYSALWFASVVLSTSGLFLEAGAQFLAAGTIIVYAGAIIVTFLFVIMLAQMEGKAVYDRMARSPRAATITSYMLLLGLLLALVGLRGSKPVELRGENDQRLVSAARLQSLRKLDDRTAQAQVLARALPQTIKIVPSDAQGRGLGTHVAGLGGTLYSDHLITVELVGALLFVALAGAIAIATPKLPVRPSASPAASA